jgi:hypothetical protein
MRLCLSHPRMTESGKPIYSSVSKSNLRYSRRVKKKIGKQLNKNKKLLTETVKDTPVVRVEGYFKGVLDATELTPNLGVTRKDFLIFSQSLKSINSMKRRFLSQILSRRGSLKI